jgi:hypothetical protein
MFNRSIFLVLLLLLSLTVTIPAGATQGGGGAYPNGAEDFMAGALPPPGTYLLNYIDYYSADRLNDNNGNKIMPGFKLDVFSEVLRVVHVTNKQLLGASWAMHLFLPIVYMDVTIPGAGSDHRTGLGDIIIDPFILGWHGANWHITTGVDFFLPTGAYDKNRLANPGRNYWTFEPVIAATWLTDSGFEVSGKLMYDFNTKNNDLDYLSGQELHLDYAIGQKLSDFNLGLAGYFYQQVTDDEQYGNKVAFNDGNKGRVFAAGPAVKYSVKNMSFSLKYLFETVAVNRSEGGNLWFKFSYAF